MINRLILIMFFYAFSVALSIAEEASPPSPNDSMAEFCKRLPRADYQNLQRVEDPSNWFEVYQITPTVKAIYEPHQWQEAISYLVEGEKKALLFDTGNGIGNIHALVTRLTNKPIIVLNSHSHFDHVGGNYAFDTIYAMDTSFTRERQQGVANKEIAEEVSAEALCRPTPNDVNEANHIGRSYKIDKFIKDGFIIDLGGRELEVLHIPGHTPDAIALLERETGLLWTGDSFYAGPIWLYAPETDLVAYSNSLERLLSELPNIKALLPAHNTPWVEPEVLPRLKAAFDKVMQGSARRQESFEGTVIYSIPGERKFSFLLRDNPFSYNKD